MTVCDGDPDAVATGAPADRTGSRPAGRRGESTPGRGVDRPPDTVRLRIDPHVHSRGSYDGSAPVERLLERAVAAGLDGIVVTDHDAIEESLRAAALAPSYGLVGIPGVEVSTADGHLLAIGVADRPEPGRPLAETVSWIRTRGGVAVVPHPFQVSRHGVRRSDLTDCDGVEVYNAFTVTGLRNRHARAFARRRGYPALAGSDAHTVPTVGNAYTVVTIDGGRSASPDELPPRAVVEAIRDGHTAVRGSAVPLERYCRKFVRNAELRTAGELPARLRRLVGRDRASESLRIHDRVR